MTEVLQEMQAVNFLRKDFSIYYKQCDGERTRKKIVKLSFFLEQRMQQHVKYLQITLIVFVVKTISIALRCCRTHLGKNFKKTMFIFIVHIDKNTLQCECIQYNQNFTCINEIVHRICGHSGGTTFTKQNLGPTNVMIVRFDSDRHNTVSPGEGFTLTVTAVPSGNTGWITAIQSTEC